MFHAIGTLFIVPTTVLLMLSFFTLVVLVKVQEKFLRLFGWAVVILLWLSALTVFMTGMYIKANGHDKMMGYHRSVMMQCPMMKDGGMSGSMMNNAGSSRSNCGGMKKQMRSMKKK